jgi:hypothetical protein
VLNKEFAETSLEYLMATLMRLIGGKFKIQSVGLTHLFKFVLMEVANMAELKLMLLQA